MNKPFATVLESATSLQNKTGSWRTVKPEYVKRLPPCNAACPAGENIQQWLSLAQEGNFLEAWNVIMQNNPFPATMGRACYHTCEKVCNRGKFDGAVNINLLERSIGDLAIVSDWEIDAVGLPTNKKVLVIGAGPSGLSAAYFLRKYGHEVTIYERHIKPGGMMRYGVPSYRLPRWVIDAEIRRIINCGVKLFCNRCVSNIKEEMRNFDAIYIATGTSVPTKVDVETNGETNILNAIDLFKKMEDHHCGGSLGETLGKIVLVYGGGNTAIDAARTALRLGAENVKIVYRRTLEKMPAHDSEIQDALQEGIEILCLRSISMIDGKKILLDKMNYNAENNTLSKNGENEIITADSIIFAVGQSIDADPWASLDGLVVSEKGALEIDKNMMTGVGGIFAGGDVVLGKKTITDAIGHGKKSAQCINAYLHNTEIAPGVKTEVVNFKKINFSYFKTTNPLKVEKFDGLSFEEKNISLSSKEIISESRRCFSCGNCFHCDNCYGFCPDNAIRKSPDGTLAIDYDYCKGCGICSNECPCGAIKMVAQLD
ncbi:MAG: FAD-dependent oxidoreductase [Holosporaceae bacterium]|jgi:2-oxoacid:acceptor oxidoreductase delta subunit (pyruvate/2-ketoisovalerate family)|nr:FAD-dependent oxidoreductase [Holosporaceae bacterium]